MYYGMVQYCIAFIQYRVVHGVLYTVQYGKVDCKHEPLLYSVFLYYCTVQYSVHVLYSVQCTVYCCYRGKGPKLVSVCNPGLEVLLLPLADISAVKEIQFLSPFLENYVIDICYAYH